MQINSSINLHRIATFVLLLALTPALHAADKIKALIVDGQKGRVVHTTLGHDTEAFEGVGFITAFLRGTEWAATGKVTHDIPADFPGADKPSVRFFKSEVAK